MTLDLVDRAKQGDRDAFEQLAQAVATRLYSTATLILRDRLMKINLADLGE